MAGLQDHVRGDRQDGQGEGDRDRQVAVGDAGSGLFSATSGVLLFLLFMLFAVQIAYHLYATSVVTAAAYDGARIAAGADASEDPARGAALAREKVYDLLGEYGRKRVHDVDVAREGNDVVVRVVAANPSFLPFALRHSVGFDVVDRTVRVRVEQEVAP